MKRLQTWLGIGVSAVFLYFAFRHVDGAEVGRGILQANYLWLLISLLLTAASVVVRARRWQALFRCRERLHFGHVFGVLNVGYLINDILPLRAGELVRAYLLGQVEAVSRVETLGTILVERAVDTLAVIVMLAAVAPFVAVPANAVRPVLVLTVAMILLVIAMLLAAARRRAALALVERLAGLLPERFRGPVVQHAGSGIDGLAVLSNPRAAAQVLGLTALVYLLATGAVEALLLAFHLHLGVAGPFFVLAAATLGLVVPSSPGSVGVWEGVVIATLTRVFSIERSPAASFALVSHAVLFAPPILFAVLYLWRSSASWGNVLSLGRRAADQAPAASAE